MEAQKLTVIIYETEIGVCPFMDWFRALRDKSGKARILVRLERIEKGNFGDSKPVQRGVSELRVDAGPGYRVYYGRHHDSVVVLLCGGDKSSQRRDIEKAWDFLDDYRRRYDADAQ